MVDNNPEKVLSIFSKDLIEQKQYDLDMLMQQVKQSFSKSAKINYEKGYLIDAENDMVLANSILKPGHKFWQYQKAQKAIFNAKVKMRKLETI